MKTFMRFLDGLSKLITKAFVSVLAISLFTFLGFGTGLEAIHDKWKYLEAFRQGDLGIYAQIFLSIFAAMSIFYAFILAMAYGSSIASEQIVSILKGKSKRKNAEEESSDDFLSYGQAKALANLSDELDIPYEQLLIMREKFLRLEAEQ